MKKEEVIKYCKLYKGGNDLPAQYADADGQATDEGMIWLAEKYIVENLAEEIGTKDHMSDMENWICAFVGTWNPYEWGEIMQVYKALPTL